MSKPEKLVIAFTNYSKLRDVEFKKDELKTFFETTKLGFGDSKKLFLIVTDDNYNFVDDVPADLSNVGAVICYDANNIDAENANVADYVKKVEGLFAKLPNLGIPIQIIHHHNQNAGILALINNLEKIEIIKGMHITNNPEYKSVIDIIINLRTK